MSQWIGFTNQKLYQCRLLLAQREQASDASLAKALEESALYQLHDAWRSYLQELADMVSLRDTVTSLPDLLQRAPLVTGEMNELRQLTGNSFSWLAQMLSAVSALQQPGVNRPRSAAEAVTLISIADDSSATPVNSWLKDLTRLIEGQRENRQES